MKSNALTREKTIFDETTFLMQQKEKYRILGINLLVALALTLMLNLSFLLVREHPGRRPDFFPGFYILVQVLYFFFVSWVMLTVNTVKRLSLIRRIGISVILLFLLYFLTPEFHRGRDEWSIVLYSRKLYNPFHVLRFSFLGVVSVLYWLIYDLIYQKQYMAIENERLRSENLQTRFNLLANQISPHFLFNSLNSLTMLVREGSSERALHYIDQLADTFRYTLQSGKNELTTLSEEMRFSEAYFYLLSIRYENKLFWDVAVEPRYMAWRLPSMSLMPLIENAVKHNTITLAQPFRISIRTENDQLIVSNPLAPKIESTTGTGIGLKNLSQRYVLLTGRDVVISDEGGIFTVTLPLLQP